MPGRPHPPRATFAASSRTAADADLIVSGTLPETKTNLGLKVPNGGKGRARPGDPVPAPRIRPARPPRRTTLTSVALLPGATTLAYRLHRAGRPGRHRSVLGRPVSHRHIQTVLHERRDRSLLARHHRQAALRLIQHVADVCEVEHPALPELGEQVVIGQAAQAQLASTDRAIAGTSTRTRWSASLPSSGRKRRRPAIRWTPTMVSRATAPVA